MASGEIFITCGAFKTSCERRASVVFLLSGNAFCQNEFFNNGNADNMLVGNGFWCVFDIAVLAFFKICKVFYTDRRVFFVFFPCFFPQLFDFAVSCDVSGVFLPEKQGAPVSVCDCSCVDC